MQPLPAEIDRILRSTLDDHRLSRGEQAALRQLVTDWGHDPAALHLVRQHAFALVREALPHPGAPVCLAWLEEVVKVLTAVPPPVPTSTAEACFSPGDTCLNRIRRLLNDARRTLEICVFTISDDRITSEIIAARRRGVQVRVISDDDKMHDAGSDIARLADAGIPVAIDETPAHMHHKFAIFDGAILLTGSYNWTRSAASDNHEDIVVLSDAKLVADYQATFNELWSTLQRV